ncbi:hypothetical protein L1049_021106 [Liquidambar formosana]|uniref:Uncharacterized protein n=1 Tax=Liquidambar formosana TaxID=63359 RepID=A0AAP0SE11_LIQFO
MPSGGISKEKLATRRFEFNGTNLGLLKAKAAFGNNPTRVEAVTALIWKSAIAAAKANSGTERNTPSTILTHVVNFRGRMDPPLPDHSVGNLWQFAVAPMMQEKESEKIELHDLACLLRKSIKKIDGDYLRGLQGDDGLAKACESLKEVRQMASKGEVELYRFSSWTRFPFYEADFGWGKPIWVCTTSVPMKNVVILMGTRCGDGIEAWVSLAEHEMAQFERNHELLQFVSSSPTS